LDNFYGSSPDATHSWTGSYEWKDDDDHLPDVFDEAASNESMTAASFDEASLIEDMVLARVIAEWEISRHFSSLQLESTDKMKVDGWFKRAYDAFVLAQYEYTLSLLGEFSVVNRIFALADMHDPDVVRFYTSAKLLQARTLFKQAKYVEAKILLDEVLRVRSEVFGITHWLTAEIYYHFAQWCLSQALYNECEQILNKVLY